MTITIERLNDRVQIPVRATAQSAGYDLAASYTQRDVKVFTPSNAQQVRHVEQFRGGATGIVLYPGERAMIPLGFKATLPDGIEAQIRPRSGTALKLDLSLVNAPGTVDADFPDEWHVLVVNRSQAATPILEGQKIAQMVLAKYDVLEIVDGTVVQTTERAGGYGSTDGAPKQVAVTAEIVADPAVSADANPEEAVVAKAAKTKK